MSPIKGSTLAKGVPVLVAAAVDHGHGFFIHKADNPMSTTQRSVLIHKSPSGYQTVAESIDADNRLAICDETLVVFWPYTWGGMEEGCYVFRPGRKPGLLGGHTRDFHVTRLHRTERNLVLVEHSGNEVKISWNDLNRDQK